MLSWKLLEDRFLLSVWDGKILRLQNFCTVKSCRDLKYIQCLYNNQVCPSICPLVYQFLTSLQTDLLTSSGYVYMFGLNLWWLSLKWRWWTFQEEFSFNVFPGLVSSSSLTDFSVKKVSEVNVSLSILTCIFLKFSYLALHGEESFFQLALLQEIFHRYRDKFSLGMVLWWKVEQIHTINW